MLAQILCLVIVPVSRYISPKTFLDGHYVYLAWLPLSVMLAVIFLFGRHAILPIIFSFALTNLYQFQLTILQQVVILFCQTASVFAACGVVRVLLGRRWRFGLPNQHIGIRIFWLGFAIPLGIKVSMYLAGYFFDFPLSISIIFKAVENKNGNIRFSVYNEKKYKKREVKFP